MLTKESLAQFKFIKFTTRASKKYSNGTMEPKQLEIKTNQKIKTKIIAIKKEKIIKKNIDIDIDRILEKGEEKNVK